MKRMFVVSTLALVASGVTFMQAEAQGRAPLRGADPLVIPGIGPEDVAPAQRVQRRQPVRVAGRSNLGGGFIEFLVRGNTASRHQGRRVIYNRPPPVAVQPRRRPAAMPPQLQAPVRARRQMQAYAPFSGGAAAVRRTVRSPVPARYQRQEVAYSGKEKPGTIVVDTPNRFLYYVLGKGRAIRYGIGVGRPGFEWSGIKRVSRKAQWPDWRPPASMLKRRPDLPRFMKGGIDNPLGARALYLGSSLYRIHGTNEPYTIGKNVSSGCIRMLNKDVIDLYNRVRVGARVKVI